MRSKGHIGFSERPSGKVEYFERDGVVLAAPIANPVMPDGYRCGRERCLATRWEQVKAVFGIELFFVLEPEDYPTYDSEAV